MKQVAICLLLLLLIVSAACQTNSTTNSTRHARDNSRTLDNNDEKIAALVQRVTALEQTVQWDKFLIDQKQSKNDAIDLDTTSHSYQRLDTENGSFLISVKDVVPYLNGFKVTIDIGNPYSASVAGVKLTVKWAKAYNFSKFSSDTYKQWQDSTQSKEVELTDKLQPGTWNHVELILSPATADQLGFLELSMTSNSIVLNTNSVTLH